ncbi:hypothetical protein GQ41_1651 [Arenibacter algicola]|uniref:Uncharacterized protein n=1 Tax=Arenibacter algicola TaxID=616991 RepID=A0ABY3A9N9_9FLAO
MPYINIQPYKPVWRIASYRPLSMILLGAKTWPDGFSTSLPAGKLGLYMLN